MIAWSSRVAGILCILMSALTALPFVKTDEWWIRILDFPRLQIAAVLVIALLFYGVTQQGGIRAIVVAVISFAALAYQVSRILPYSPIWPQQMIAASDCLDRQRVRFLVANVLQENRKSKRLLHLLEQTDPDIILLTEIDHWWAEEVEELAKTHPWIILEPRSDTYGIGLYSRYPLRDGIVRYLIEDDIPSILTRVVLPNGALFYLWGVHPSPPRPGDDTDERDAELLLVAKEAANVAIPAVIAGDLNDVAWSSTTNLFQEISGMLDPRIGRGLYATFNANWPLLKWPLDHLFASEEWTLVEFSRLDDIGSDHYPILVELCHEPSAAAIQRGDALEPGDAEDAKEHIEEGR